jgi:hypothetical protein
MYREAILEEVRPAEMPRRPIIENDRNFTWITQKVCGIVEGRNPDVVVGCLHPCALIASFTGNGPYLPRLHRYRCLGIA